MEQKLKILTDQNRSLGKTSLFPNLLTQYSEKSVDDLKSENKSSKDKLVEKNFELEQVKSNLVIVQTEKQNLVDVLEQRERQSALSKGL